MPTRQTFQSPDDWAETCAAWAWDQIERGEMGQAESGILTALLTSPHHALLHSHLGTLYLKTGRLDQSIKHLMQALQIEPKMDDTAATLAWALHDQGQYANAVLWARRALALRISPERFAQLGWLHLCLGKPNEAIPLFNQSLIDDPTNTVSHLHLARSYSEVGQRKTAERVLTKGLEHAPNEPTLLLALAWLHHERGDQAHALTLATQVTEIQNSNASAWHLLGVSHLNSGNNEQAVRYLEHAFSVDPKHADIAYQLAYSYYRSNRPEDAKNTISIARLQHPRHYALGKLSVQIALDEHHWEVARQITHQFMGHQSEDGDLWYFIALVLFHRGRTAAAKRFAHRAIRLCPNHHLAYLLLAHIALACVEVDGVRWAISRFLTTSPNRGLASIHAALVLAECGDLDRASQYAEFGLASNSESSEAWRVLGRVRQLQGQLDEAQALTQISLSKVDLPSEDSLRQLAWTLRGQGLLTEACAVFIRATKTNPHSATSWYELADTHYQMGDTTLAWSALQRALELEQDHNAATVLRIRLLADANQHSQAAKICAHYVHKYRGIQKITGTLMVLAAQGQGYAGQLLQNTPRPERLRLTHQALADAQDRADQATYVSLAKWACSQFPENPAIAATALYVKGLCPDYPPSELAHGLRDWQRLATTHRNASSVTHELSAVQAANRIRLAYVASHYHSSLLRGMLAAHDASKFEVFLYADLEDNELRGLPERIHRMPLQGTDLAASMFANRIAIAIDTVGVLGFPGQESVLQQFVRRVAPVQCAWLGSWASSGGVFDYLLSDEHAIPNGTEDSYAEDIVRLPGGQWSWTPPADASEPGQPPCLTSARVTFACPVRAFRIGSLPLKTWARLLQRLPSADLVFMGEHGTSVGFRRKVKSTFNEFGINADRVRYQSRRPYQRYLEAFCAIDIVLDTFPANGGLCLLDALWMGIPVVTLAGHWLGERQGVSILSSIDCGQWVASSPDQYIDIACSLAADPQHLAELRQTIRKKMSGSSLLDNIRLARAIERVCLELRQRAEPIAHALTSKERARAAAALQLEHWFSTTQRIDLSPASHRIDVSVVVVLFNQAGLSRQCLAALADQKGVCFETIIVDNASSDRTCDLLARLDGITLIRNTDNVGFLKAANQAAARACGRHLLFLNNDAVVHSNALQQGVNRLDSDKTVGAVGGRIVLGSASLQEAGCIVYQDGSTSGYGRGRDPHAPEFAFLRDVDFCSGAFLMLRRSLWQTLHGFDPVFAPAYYEDTDLCLRIQDAGFRVVYDPSIWLTHFEWASAPTPEGAAKLMAGRRSLFAQRHQLRLASRVLPEYACPHRDRSLASMRAHVLIIDNAVPHMAAGGGLPRARLLVHALSKSHHVTLYPLWNYEDDWHDVYASVPETVEVMLRRGAASLEAFLEERRGVYDFLLVSRPPNMAFIDKIWSRRPELFEDLRLVYDAEAVFALRDIGKAKVLGRPMTADQAQQLVNKEIALAQRAETVLCVSTSEVELFSSHGARSVALLDHAMATRSATPKWEERTHLLFVGAIHPDTPNEDSLLWFCERVMPYLRSSSQPNLRISVVGDCSSEKVQALASDEICIVGRVDDLSSWYDSHRVFIAPTRFGAGIPAKVIEAACNGIPVVATPLLVNQLGWTEDYDIVCGGEDGAAFARAILHLYQNRDCWNTIHGNMTETTMERYSPSKFTQTLEAVFAKTCEQPI